MKTNVEIDDELLEAARRVTGLKSEREVIAAALRHLVQLPAQERVRELRGRGGGRATSWSRAKADSWRESPARSASNGLARLAGIWTPEEFREFEAAVAGTDFPLCPRGIAPVG